MPARLKSVILAAIGITLLVVLILAIVVFTRSGTLRPEEWKGHTRSVEAIAWSPDGRFIASGGFDRSVRLWDSRSGTPIMTMSGVSDTVLCLAFSSDSRFLAAGTHGRTIHLWEVPSGRIETLPQPHRGYITAIAFSGDGRLMATGSHEKLVVLWDFQSQSPRRKLWGFRHWVGAVNFSPDSRSLAVGEHGGVRVFDTESGTETGRINSALIHWVAYSPDRKTLALGGSYGRAALYDATSLKLLLQMPTRSASSAEFSPDGSKLATGGGTSVTLWDVRTGKQRSVVSGRAGPDLSGWLVRILPFLRPAPAPPIRAITLSPDGRSIAAACPDNLVRVWREVTR